MYKVGLDVSTGVVDLNRSFKKIVDFLCMVDFNVYYVACLYYIFIEIFAMEIEF